MGALGTRTVLDTFYARLMRCGNLACTGRPFTEHRTLIRETLDETTTALAAVGLILAPPPSCSPTTPQPGMHLRYVICDRLVPVIVKQPGLDAGNVRGQPFTVTDWHELVLPAVQQQDRDSYVSQVESPRPQLHAVLVPALVARRQPVLRAAVGRGIG
jgi:hypothetical protein